MMEDVAKGAHGAIGQARKCRAELRGIDGE